MMQTGQWKVEKAITLPDGSVSTSLETIYAADEPTAQVIVDQLNSLAQYKNIISVSNLVSYKLLEETG